MLSLFKYIPKKIGYSVFLWLLSFHIILLLGIGASLRYFVHQEIHLDAPWVFHFLAQLDDFLLSIFWGTVFITVLFYFLFTLRFFYPLNLIIHKAQRILNRNIPKQKRWPIPKSFGEWFELDLVLSQIHKDRKRRRASVVRERSELEALVTAANDAILAIDQDQNIRFFNGPMAQLMNSLEDDGLGQNLALVVPHQVIVSGFQRALTSKVPQQIETSLSVTHENLPRYFEISISPLANDKKGNSLGAVALFHDITEHKKTEKIRMDFVANASHELKTPVTSIQGCVSMLRHQLKDTAVDVTKPLEVIERNSRRLSSLVNDLLHLSQIEGADEIRKEKILVEEITESLVVELEPLWQEKNQKVLVHYEVEDVWAHRDYLEHVILNLVGNAIKYSQEGAEIHILWRDQETHILLSIKDNGPGIESFHLGRLFERFYRIRDKEGLASIKGTGLGLSIVRHAMIKQKGKIDVKSAPGLGSDFLCYFPVH